jgi:hypothetical protein
VLDRIVATTRSRVQPPASPGSLLAGLRDGDLVAAPLPAGELVGQVAEEAREALGSASTAH